MRPRSLRAAGCGPSPDRPAGADRHTCLLANFDAADSNDRRICAGRTPQQGMVPSFVMLRKTTGEQLELQLAMSLVPSYAAATTLRQPPAICWLSTSSNWTRRNGTASSAPGTSPVRTPLVVNRWTGSGTHTRSRRGSGPYAAVKGGGRPASLRFPLRARLRRHAPCMCCRVLRGLAR